MTTIQTHSKTVKNIIALITTISLLLLTSCSQKEMLEALELDHENVFSITVGICFDDTSEYENEVDTVPVRKCSQPHDNEIYYSYELTGDAYPESDEADQAMLERCEKEFENFIGLSYDESIYDYDLLSPSKLSWKNGDREVICYAYESELKSITGSLSGIRK